ncbi:OLC1v1020449C1 [Oldenlandia corymbosa var. corymbosa]|uniref:OLC1v1020449C1 n=1 Tax=Oldenlandia corymbosa var. corymbosa TaxID=529605 RepID=A0AAV1EGK2_OLDCO|nr:OLC1v1020449C1 [Oldenlandia corymbosa var. corymbosa]
MVELPKLAFDCKFGEVKDDSSREKLLLRISQILLVHDGPILEFLLSMPGLENGWEINQLLRSVSKKGTVLRKLVLEFASGAANGQYTLHSSAFSCRELRKLTLRGCDIKPYLPPSFRGVLYSNFFIYGCPPCDILEVNSPKLNCLICKTHFQTSIQVVAPRLATVSMISHVSRKREKLEEKQTKLESIGFLKLVNELVLDHYYMKIVLLKAGSSFKFKHLKFLIVYGIYFGSVNEVTGALLFINSCPSLRVLRIVKPNDIKLEAFTNSDVEFFKGLMERDLSSCHVHQVDMRTVTGYQNVVGWPLGSYVAPPAFGAFAAPPPDPMGQYYYQLSPGFFGAAPSEGFPAAGTYDQLPMFNDNPSIAGAYPSGEPGQGSGEGMDNVD